MKKYTFFIVNCLLVIAISSISCKKNLTDSSPSVTLSFSSNSVLFDTVFTTIGSTTQILEVYNKYSEKINISSIRLAGGSNSMFSMNVNGTYTTSASNLTIAAHDSMFIFVKVTVNPNNKNNPMIVKDSIFFLTNGNLQNVKLIAWGQDAHFVVANTHVNGLPPYRIVAKAGGPPVVWNNDKPYVIYGYAIVDSTGSLIINEGVKVCLYNSAGLWVYKGGSIKVNGTKANPVIFQGTRLESEYQNVPGQWDRIWLNEGSTDNVINYAIIKNAFIGIQAQPDPYNDIKTQSPNKLRLSNTIISNCSGFGILAKNYQIVAGNCVIDNCGEYAIALTEGGSYDFLNCTLGNYWNLSNRQTPSLVLNNHLSTSNGIDSIDYKLNEAYFGNCVLWGNLQEEILLDSNKHNTGFNYNFEHCLIKTQTLKLKTQNSLFNQDPLFFNINYYNYHLKSSSPALLAGTDDIILNESDPTLKLILNLDLDGNVRTTGSIALGAY